MALTGITTWRLCSDSGVVRSRDDDCCKGSLFRVLRGGAGRAMRGCRGHHQGWSEAEGATGSCGQRASVVVSLGEGKRGKQVWDWPVLIASMGPGAPGLSLPI